MFGLNFKPPRKQTVFQCIYIGIIGLMMGGFMPAFSTVALPYLSNEDTTSKVYLNTDMSAFFGSLFTSQFSQIIAYYLSTVSIVSITNAIGYLITIFLIKHGRRLSILVGGSFCTIGWILIASSTTVIQLMAGRAITGLAEPIISASIRIYASEMLTVDLARTVNPLISSFFSIGYLLTCISGYLLKSNWRLVAAVVVFIITPPLILVALFLPESPRWLLLMDRKEEARKSLLILRGLEKTNPDFENEFAEMVAYNEEKCEEKTTTSSTHERTDAGENSSRLKNFKTKIQFVLQILKLPEVWKPFVILNIFFSISDLSGGPVLFSYGVDVLRRAGVTSDPFFVVVIIGILQLTGDITLAVFSIRMGRRSVAISTGVVVSILLIILGVYNQLFLETGISTIPLTCLLLLVVLETVGFINLPWTMLVEIYPTRYIHIFAPLSFCFQTPYAFLATQFYPALAKHSFFTLIYLYSGAAILGTLFLAIVLPETAGKSKSEIEDHFRNKGKPLRERIFGKRC